MNLSQQKAYVQKLIVIFSVVLFAASAIGYLAFPREMLSVVGIVGDERLDFLARAVGVALLSFVPAAWSARGRTQTGTERHVLVSLGAYMLLSAAEDLCALWGGLVQGPALPSISIRLAMAGVFAWLIKGEPYSSN